jgi:diacylglycerol kinase (ATP)
MAGIGVILNPYSKKYKKKPHKLHQMAFIIGDRASYRPTDDLGDLHRVIEGFKTHDIDLLAISGGDGTIHTTLTALIKVYGKKQLPQVTFLRGGTLNTIAATLGIRGETEKLMSSLLIRYHENKDFKEKKLRLTKINDEYGCIFGVGMVYRFMAEYYKNPKLNPAIAAQTVIKTITSTIFHSKMARDIFKRFDAEVMVDGEKWPFANYASIFSSSISQAGLNFHVFHHMLTQNEKFHLMGISLDAWNVLPCLKRMHDGKPAGCSEILDAAASDVIIKLSEPMPYTIDGDMLEPLDTFHLSAGPEVTVLV